MAFTIQQVIAQLPNPPPPRQDLYVDISLTIIQEDGRVGYMGGPGVITRITGQPSDIRLRTEVVFNDRDRFRGNADTLEITLTPRGTTSCHAAISLVTWGGGYECDLALPPSSGTTGILYQGYGNTIGFGTGRALHLLSFNNVRLGDRVQA
jgi:hypothetical protein